MAKYKSSIPDRFYKEMDKHFAEKYRSDVLFDLASRRDLVDMIGDSLFSFLDWGSLQRVHFQPDIEDEVTEFLSQRKRLYSINVKEWYRLINIVFERDNYKCTYCGASGGKLEADHIIPFSRGGDDTLENLTTSCQKCNRQKKDMSVEEFNEWRLKR